MRLIPQKAFAGREAHWICGNQVLASQGYELVTGDLQQGVWRPAGKAPASLKDRCLSSVSLVSRALRLGIHHAVPLKSGAIVAVVNGRILRSEAPGQDFQTVHRFRLGRKPARRGITAISDGRVFYGEYVTQVARVHPICIYESEDEGRTYHEVYRFEAPQIRHLHFIQEDPYESGLWVGTGDLGDECRMLRSLDGCRSFEMIGMGGQGWRAVSVIFRPDAVYWGTDAGCDAGTERNHIYRWDRASRDVERVLDVQGPVHGSAETADGTMLISTGVEGGVNEQDRQAHLWASRDGRNWQEVTRWKKDIWPFRVQYGVIHFAQGQETSHVLCLNLRGLSGHGMTCLTGTLEPD